MPDPITEAGEHFRRLFRDQLDGLEAEVVVIIRSKGQMAVTGNIDPAIGTSLIVVMATRLLRAMTWRDRRRIRQAARIYSTGLRRINA